MDFPRSRYGWRTSIGAIGTVAAVGVAMLAGSGVAAAGGRAAPVGAGGPCAPSARACMVVSTHQAWLTDGAGHVTYGPVPARAGTAGAPTPIGTFHVLSKNAHYYSREFDAPMPYAVFFYPGDAFHADSTRVNSNGCIHLSSAAAQRFYSTLRVGDEVQIRQR